MEKRGDPPIGVCAPGLLLTRDYLGELRWGWYGRVHCGEFGEGHYSVPMAKFQADAGEIGGQVPQPVGAYFNAQAVDVSGGVERGKRSGPVATEPRVERQGVSVADQQG
jgi:hypothetical protein